MAPGNSAAVSHVGKIRANNQDSGYAGEFLFVVADGMGGHAGGDVASAIAVKRIIETDHHYTSGTDAEFALHTALTAANAQLAGTVFDHSELTGMGTTVSGLMLVNGQVVIAHIGDSRIYLLRDGELSQVTADHTFVQRLVDSGRITEEEAAVHPRRSVLMRVLGDVDATPEIDTSIMATQPGDRWLLCSDGLSSYVSHDKILHTLMANTEAQAAADRLVKDALDQGAPDNVTVVLVDIDESGVSAHVPPVTVGSAASPLVFDGDVAKKPLRLPALLLHPLKVTKPDDSHFEPESDGYLDELILEDRRRAKRRRITWLVGLILVVVAVVGGTVAAYQWTQTRFYVGSNQGNVAIFRGVQQGVGPISLSSVYRTTTIDIDDLPDYSRSTVEATINASDLSDAERIVEQLSNVSDQ
ncbi:protein phosphatase [Conyzicola lurida]|uniref:Protein phosphatase n=1 Tax=Conyzicola lurida TaxID=1172621 RepID=A0A841ASL0_9MICO|nr:protein phosphatase [Conyzicola lurida]